MNSTLLKWECAGIIFIFLLGAFVHFGYELTNRINLFSAIFAVNESIWEHGKLTFWAPLIYALIEYFFIGKYYPNFLTAKTISAIVTTVAMIVLYYTVLWGIGHHSFPGDLIIYEISIVIGLAVSYFILARCPYSLFLKKISITVLCISVFIFYLFSYNPPKLPLFKCNQSGGYGIGIK